MSINLSLAGRNALVTGASSGLGPWIAKRLDEAGACVCLHYHSNQAGAESVAASLTNLSTIVQADLSDPDSVQRLFDTAASELGAITILVNCAAAESQNVEDLANMTGEKWSATQRTNVEAPLLLTRLVAAQGQPGAIVNISSIEGSRPAPGHSHYSASKAALEMLTRAAALEFGSKGLRVNAIAPGLIHRDGIQTGWPEGVEAWQTAAPLGRLVDPAHIADAVVFLASDSAGSTTGTVLTIDCGLSVTSGW